jgi:uncharacterized cupin superfamily protein
MDVLTAGPHAPDMPLDEYGPISESIGIALDGPMSHRGRVFWQSENGKVACGLWEVDAGRFSCVFDGEMVHVVKGTIVATDEEGSTITLGPGDVYTFTPGWKGIWEMREPMRKFFTTFRE